MQQNISYDKLYFIMYRNPTQLLRKKHVIDCNSKSVSMLMQVSDNVVCVCVCVWQQNS